MKTAAEGGAWGMAVLALFAISNSANLSKFLDSVFVHSQKKIVMANKSEIKKCASFIERYRKGLQAEKQLSESI